MWCALEARDGGMALLALGKSGDAAAKRSTRMKRSTGMKALSGRRMVVASAGGGVSRRRLVAGLCGVVLLFLLVLLAFGGGCIEPQNACGPDSPDHDERAATF